MNPEDYKDVLPMINNKVDYNFQTIIHLSILIEFLFTKLKEYDSELDLETGLEEFQKQKIEELQEATNEAVQSLKEEDQIDIKL